MAKKIPRNTIALKPNTGDTFYYPYNGSVRSEEFRPSSKRHLRMVRLSQARATQGEATTTLSIIEQQKEIQQTTETNQNTQNFNILKLLNSLKQVQIQEESSATQTATTSSGGTTTATLIDLVGNFRSTTINTSGSSIASEVGNLWTTNRNDFIAQSGRNPTPSELSTIAKRTIAMYQAMRPQYSLDHILTAINGTQVKNYYLM